MEHPLLQKFTSHYKQVLNQAYAIAQRLGARETEPIHVVWALVIEPGSLATEILRKAGLEAPRETAQKDAAGDAPQADAIFTIPLTARLKQIVKQSVLAASRYHHKYIGTEHLLMSLLEDSDPAVTDALQRQHIDITILKKHLALVMKSTSRFPDLTQALTQDDDDEEEEELPKERRGKSKTPALDFFARELTSAQIQTTIDPVIGRAREINRIIQILSRKTKNNPILLGDPGVGKTAIVEGLAKRIHQGDVPDILLRKRVYNLDLALLVAGTMYRGEFESRIKQVLDEVKANPDIILFIDELHTIIGAGSASGALDAANIIKPALARGDIRCIGATTYEEYKRHIETDPALERRFQAVQVKEPSIEETIDILKGIKTSYEQHHRVRLTDDALHASATLAAQYLPEKRLPDKAIDLIDEASAMRRIARGGTPHLRALRELETKLSEIARKKEDAVQKENFPLALSLKEEERALRANINALAAKKEDELHPPADTAVTKHDILRVLSDMTGIPLGSIEEEEREHLVHLEERLRARIIGQDEALKEISGFIRRSRAGLAGKERPLGSFIFLGPSGVGKTETAKALAETVFHDASALIRFDMSEYGESFTTSKLIGAPAGYVGYREGGKLTEMIRRKPYAVILLDEIEKAHPDVFNLFLSILDEGHVTDATGRRIDFRNTIIIMTSNIGLQAFNAQASLGFSETDARAPRETYTRTKETALKELSEHFRPEFLNRVDRILVFNPLDKQALQSIVLLHLAQLQSSLTAQSLTLRWNTSAIRLLTELSLSPGEGARRIARVLREQVENQITDAILAERALPSSAISLTVKQKQIALTITSISKKSTRTKPRRRKKISM